MLVQPIIWTC